MDRDLEYQSRARSAERCIATASSVCCARRFAPAAGDLPADHDYVVVARPEARELAEREGLEGIAGSLAELLEAAGK